MLFELIESILEKIPFVSNSPTSVLESSDSCSDTDYRKRPRITFDQNDRIEEFEEFDEFDEFDKFDEFKESAGRSNKMVRIDLDEIHSYSKSNNPVKSNVPTTFKQTYSDYDGDSDIQSHNKMLLLKRYPSIEELGISLKPGVNGSVYVIQRPYR